MNDDGPISELPDILQRYVGAWNNHDGPGIAATFAPNGTYSDPMTQGPLAGEAITRYAEDLWQSFPDLRFELDDLPLHCEGSACLPWRMLATNAGSFNGLPPTGKSLAVPGVDIVRFSPEGLLSVTGYFDSRAVPEQLGLKVTVQPDSIGPFTFGVSTRVASGRTATPQAFTVTSLEPRTREDAEEVRALGREVLKEMLGMEGFIAATAITCGNRQMTFTAWEKSENIGQMRNSASHNEAMRRFYGPQLSAGGIFSIWHSAPTVRSNQRCQECGQMVSIDGSSGKCRCGARIEVPSYW